MDTEHSMAWYDMTQNEGEVRGEQQLKNNLEWLERKR